MSAPPVLFKSMSFRSVPAPAPPTVGLAGLRVVAAVVDLGVGFATFLLLAAAIGTFEISSHAFAISLDGWPGLVWMATQLLYFMLCESLAGATLGKAAVGLRVVCSADGSRPGVTAIAARTLLRLIDALPIAYGVGLALILLTPRQQRLGDLAARTVVVRAR